MKVLSPDSTFESYIKLTFITLFLARREAFEAFYFARAYGTLFYK
jgi:hypothetical protein